MAKTATIKKLYGERPEHWMRNALIAAGRSNDDISEFGFGSETFDPECGFGGEEMIIEVEGLELIGEPSFEADFGGMPLMAAIKAAQGRASTNPVQAKLAALNKMGVSPTAFLQAKRTGNFSSILQATMAKAKQAVQHAIDTDPNVIQHRTVAPALVPAGPGGALVPLPDSDLRLMSQHKFMWDGHKKQWSRLVSTMGGRFDPKMNGAVVGDLFIFPASAVPYTVAVLKESHRKYVEAKRRKNLPWHKKFSRGLKKAVKAVGKAITSIPVIGPAIEVTANAVAGSIMFPIQVAKNIAEGKRIDRAVYEPFKERVKEIQAVAPYVQSVVSFIPGIGTGVAAAIGAANALTKGQPITDALIEGAKGAIPGGPVAAAAFDVGVAAMKGKPIDEVMMQAIPLPAEQKKLIVAGAKSVKDIANGKNVAESLYNNAKGYLPKEAQTALDAGLAIAQGQNLQKITATVAPKLAPALGGMGEQRIARSPVLQAGLKVLTPANAKGYKVGLGFMAHKVNPTAMIALRRSLPPQEKKGFDIAVSTHVGTVRAPLKDKKIPPAERFGYYATQGLQGGKPSLNASMMKTIIKDPETRKGAGKAATQIKRQRNLSGKERGFWAWVSKTIKKIKTEVKELV